LRDPWGDAKRLAPAWRARGGRGAPRATTIVVEMPKPPVDRSCAWASPAIGVPPVECINQSLFPALATRRPWPRAALRLAGGQRHGPGSSAMSAFGLSAARQPPTYLLMGWVRDTPEAYDTKDRPLSSHNERATSTADTCWPTEMTVSIVQGRHRPCQRPDPPGRWCSAHPRPVGPVQRLRGSPLRLLTREVQDPPTCPREAMDLDATLESARP